MKKERTLQTTKHCEMKIFIVSLYLMCHALGQDLAEKKCFEYGRAVFQETKSLFFSGKTLQNVSTCALFENPLIVGGTPARVKEFPHMSRTAGWNKPIMCHDTNTISLFKAVIGYAPTVYGDMDWLCGGSLISEQHVLTAAHCTVSQRGPPQKVKLGSINLEVDDDYIQEVKISRFVNHPEYRRPIKYHDIAILFLKDKVKFTAFVRPACLSKYYVSSGYILQATGFGRTSYDKQKTSTILLKVKLDIITKSVCQKYLKFRTVEMPQNITDGLWCAGNLKGGQDTCQGDSGGPLQVVLDKPYCMYGIVGVTSFGRFCGMPFSPGIYTNVAEYIPWIESTIWP